MGLTTITSNNPSRTPNRAGAALNKLSQCRSTVRRLRLLVQICRISSLLSFLALNGAAPYGVSQTGQSTLELTRAARPWEFTGAFGTRSGLFGQENGNLEAWVYPLKLFRNFHLRFHVDGETIEAASLVRSLRVRPEATTITYAWDTFSVEETLFTPINEPGAIIAIAIDTTQPIEVEAVFERDFQLEWPGAMGGSDIEWNPTLHAFSLDENQHKFSALIGSPLATSHHAEFSSNYSSANDNSFSLGVTPVGKSQSIIAMAASFQGLAPADVTYRRLVTHYNELLAESAKYYQQYLDSHLQLNLPDKSLQAAYEWAQVSVLQGLVTNPYLGTGLVAGYKDSSNDDQRPGYAWFFGRDALWTSFALNAEGDYATTRQAIEFLSKYQRKDGKITHEIAQGASFVPWFESMPYAYASADATPLYIIAIEDYVRHSGDVSIAQSHWDNITRAYDFLVSTYDKNGVPKNDGVGHGWVEGGPLLPVKNEFYQAAVGVQALKSLAYLSERLGHSELETKLLADYDHAKLHLNQAFWIAKTNHYAYALDARDEQVDTTSVLATVPMWFGLLEGDKADSMIHELSGPQIQTAWGMRIIGDDDSKYDAAGYHSGTVWPLFTGWAAVGEYRYHETLPAYANLRSNALLTFDGSLSHVTEVLSGSYYQTLSSASPHQIWSSAMVISPLLKGLLGLDADAELKSLTFSPHIPSDWTHFDIQHINVGECFLTLHYHKSVNLVQLGVQYESGTGTNSTCSVDFSPAISLRSRVVRAEFDGRPIPFHVTPNANDQHVELKLPNLSSRNGNTSLKIQLQDDFGLSQKFDLPILGGTNNGLRVISQTWNPGGDVLTLDTASASTGTYNLSIWNPDQVVRVDGADLLRYSDLKQPTGTLRITIDKSASQAYAHRKVTLYFAEPDSRKQKHHRSSEPETPTEGKQHEQ